MDPARLWRTRMDRAHLARSGTAPTRGSGVFRDFSALQTCCGQDGRAPAENWPPVSRLRSQLRGAGLIRVKLRYPLGLQHPSYSQPTAEQREWRRLEEAYETRRNFNSS